MLHGSVYPRGQHAVELVFRENAPDLLTGMRFTCQLGAEGVVIGLGRGRGLVD
jgi:hypothetical protein